MFEMKGFHSVFPYQSFSKTGALTGDLIGLDTHRAVNRLHSHRTTEASVCCHTPQHNTRCAAQNDLYLALRPVHYPRFETPLAAIQNAAPSSAVLLLADDYPVRQTALDPAGFDLARRKNLCVFIECPAALPGLELAASRTTAWERLVKGVPEKVMFPPDTVRPDQ